MELTPEEREKIYQEERARLEARSKLEAEFSKKDGGERRTVYSVLQFVGATLLIAGFSAVAYYAWIFQVAVPVQDQFLAAAAGMPASVNNVGLIAERQNGITIAGLIAVLGTASLLAGLIAGLQTSPRTRVGPVVAYTVILSFVASISLAVAHSGSGPKIADSVSHLMGGPDPNEAEAGQRLRHVGLTLLLFSGDHDGHFPSMDSAVSVQSEITPYLGHDDASIFTDPVSGEPWIYNSRLSKLSFDSIKYQSSVIMAYAPKPFSDESRLCLFVDSHVSRLSKARWDKAMTTQTVHPGSSEFPTLSDDNTLVPQ